MAVVCWGNGCPLASSPRHDMAVYGRSRCRSRWSIPSPLKRWCWIMFSFFCGTPTSGGPHQTTRVRWSFLLWMGELCGFNTMGKSGTKWEGKVKWGWGKRNWCVRLNYWKNGYHCQPSICFGWSSVTTLSSCKTVCSKLITNLNLLSVFNPYKTPLSFKNIIYQV